MLQEKNATLDSCISCPLHKCHNFLEMVRFRQSRGLWNALEEIYLLIATINKCDLSKGRRGRIYFLLAFKTRFTVLAPGQWGSHHDSHAYNLIVIL